MLIRNKKQINKGNNTTQKTTVSAMSDTTKKARTLVSTIEVSVLDKLI